MFVKDLNKAMSQKHTPEYLNQQQLEKLAQDPKNRVYTYVNDEATAKFTVAEQKKYVQDIRSKYLEIRSQFPDLKDVTIQNELRKEKSIDLFAENNTRIFELLTSRTSTQENINHIRYMLYLREQQEQGNIADHQAQSMIQDYLITAFKTNMTPKEYEAKMKGK